MTTYTVESTDDAIALAERFVAEGTYQLFRGQTQNWPMRSSMQRRAGAQQEQALEWLARFRGWLSQTDALWPIAADSDQAAAVAQHYGIATDLIDLTPDPAIAAFFATHDARAAASDEPSAILCFNLEHLRTFWAERYGGFRRPELIQLTVPNLWRLEAQRGCFLFCPYDDFESFYPVDRIVFRRTSTTRIPTVERIYPVAKSPLEVLLDQFFQKKAISEANEEWLPLMGGVVDLPSRTDGFDPNDFADGMLDVLPSWSPSQIREWIAVPHEQYSTTVGERMLEIDVPVLGTPQLVATAVFRTVLHAVYDHPALRRETMRFVIKAPEYHAPQAIAELEELLPRLWDGLRSLPCDIHELAHGIGNCVAIRLGTLAHLTSTSDEPDVWPSKPAIKRVLDADFLVEFSQEDGSYSRAYVREAALREIVRKDLYDLLKPELRASFQGDLGTLLRHVYSPQRLFDFRDLARLFVTELAPIQVLTRGSKAGPIIFSPARLEFFGLR